MKQGGFMFRRTLAAGFALAMLLTPAISSADLSNLRVYPNPARTDRGDSQITFNNVVGGGELKIYNAAGRLVFETTIDASATTYAWELTNNDRKEVASGVYIYFLKSGSDERTGKLGIIR
jgi:hypothetical protein